MDKEAIARVNKALAIPYTGVISKGTTFCEEPFVTVREADLRAILALQSSEGERLREAVRASLEQNLGVGLVDARARSLIIANALAAFDATLSPAEPSPESREGVIEECEDGEHCCCCGPGDKCCDCGATMPDRKELPALRKALRDLLEACWTADAKGDLSEDVDGDLLDAAKDALDLQYPIIWTAEQVAQLNARQADGSSHPYTCGGDRSDAAHTAQAEEDGNDNGQLIATRRGWICPACDYRQFWAHGIEPASAIRALKGDAS